MRCALIFMLYKRIMCFLGTLCFLLPLFSIAGCANTQQVVTPLTKITAATNNKAAQGPSNYILQSGDVLDIKFFFNPELNEHVTIRPDGMISLQLIGEVKAAGYQPKELNAILTNQYASSLNVPSLTVIVKEFAGQKIYVAGEVQNPGIYPAWNNTTVLQAIIQAGGYKNTAKLENVVILRHQGTETPLFITVNLKKIFDQTNDYDDFPVKPYDIIFLPKTLIAELNLLVEQYIDKLVPISRSLGLMYNINPSVR